MKLLPLHDRKFRRLLAALVALPLVNTAVWHAAGMPTTVLANLAFFSDCVAGAAAAVIAMHLLPAIGVGSK